MPQAPNAAFDNLLIPPAGERLRTRLFQQMLAAAAAMVGVLWWTAESHGSEFFLGTAICVLSVVPVLLWTRTMTHNYPIFEIFVGTNLTSYGIPLLSEHDAILLFDERIRQDAALAVILFLVSSCAAYYAVRASPRTGRGWLAPAVEHPDRRWFLRGLVLSTLYALVVPYLYVPPSGINGILRAVFFGMGTSCTFILAVAWGLGRLRPGEKAGMAVCLGLQFLLLSSSLVLRGGTALLLLAFVGHFFGARRISYAALAATLGIVALLNIGKYDLRQKYWTDNISYQPALTELPRFYAEWLQAGVHPQAQRETAAGKLLLERNSLLQILCLVVNRSPDYLPFLAGKTYAQIPGQFVPRLLWPEKPRGHISTYTLSVYYGLQTEEATYETTIAFGFIPEAYANFGFWGVAGLGAIFGACFRLITLWSVRSPIFSFAGLMLILVTAWSFQTELTLSGWLASLFQAAASIVAFLFVLRKIQRGSA